MNTPQQTSTRPAPRNNPAARESGQASPVEQLAVEAEEATRLRRLQVHPDVVALRVERVRRRVDRCMWAGILLGLGFTAANVQAFAAGDSPAGSLPWAVAWLLDPMVSVVLLGVLWAEQETGRYRIASGRTVRAVKWFTFGATYVMNTWQSWGAASPSGIVLHSVPPLLVLAAAEVGPELRHRLTAAVDRSYRHTATAAASARAEVTGSAGTSTTSGDAASSAAFGSVGGVTPVGLVALPGGRHVVSATPNVAPTRATSGVRKTDTPERPGGAKQAMRRHWDAEVAAGRMPSGADLNRAAGKDAGASLGRKYAGEWRSELDATTANQPSATESTDERADTHSSTAGEAAS
ncbi:hypothetical protein SAMN05421678_106268 [Actinopolymorpha cephalotaxi]|uniref:DUF2637 domain-containing protein n=1 Tax=Actinopolymorpha cephalotaxi TaxID=504797 RepID=A0A1I2SLA0_9ACTN|nr:hypothetical protein [Actinopolymorpha cephalotaxi]NYH84017.1 hypothetical protein [Actinopolymorpha cephalotaxi]SFG53520.1 hypothetical protein SAMN05421678_106268 [Actinopolymorpha cephalotaxi]